MVLTWSDDQTMHLICELCTNFIRLEQLKIERFISLLPILKEILQDE